jgi:hypothetical protein
MRDPFIKEDIDLDFTEWRSDFIFHDFYFYPVSKGLFFISGATFEFLFAPDFESLRGIKLQSISTGSCFWISEHDTDFHADLIDKYHSTV